MRYLKNIPRPGLRIAKSAAAVGLCYLVSLLRPGGIVFYSQLAALWCMQNYVENTRKNALQRFLGTLIGAAYGLLYLLLFPKISELWNAAVVTGLVGVVLYTTVLIKRKQASYFSCVVFLSIAVNHAKDLNPYLFVWNRCLDTIIGILIGVAVNEFSLPREKHEEILFVSGLDDTLLCGSRMSEYSRVELNRMIDEGLHFTISTCRTPASLLEPMRDIRLKLPVIVMDGAALYDLKKNRYLKCYLISNVTARKIYDLIHACGLTAFVNVVIDDMLVIYYEETEDAVQKRMVEELSASPLRNYVKDRSFEKEAVLYFMLLYPDAALDAFRFRMKRDGVTERCRVTEERVAEYPGYTCMKIYNKNASKENMLEYLKQELVVEKTITFGSIEGSYDRIVEPGDANGVVKGVRSMFEPVKLVRRLTGKK